MNGLMMEERLTLQSILQRAARWFPEREIVSRLEDGSVHRTNYAELEQRVLRLITVLRDLGVQPGDRVGTFAWNSYRHLELYFAIPCMGAVLHTINVRLQERQLTYIVEHAGDKLIFADRCFVDALGPMAGALKGVERFVVMDDGHKGDEQGLDRALDYETLMSAAAPATDLPELDEQQAAGLCYTSGTTGDPKGVLYSHRSYYLHSLGSMGVDSMQVGRHDAVLPVVPMFHVNAWGFPFTSAMAGAKLVFPGMHLLGGPLAELIESERVTIAAGVPTVWTVLLAHLRKEPRDFSHVRQMLVGGSAVPQALIKAWEEEQGVKIVHAWGMTETTPVGCCSRLGGDLLELPADEQLAVRAKQGVPVPCMDMRIEGENGEELPRDGKSVGELCVRGPWVARSYYDDESQARAFTDDGWFRTGDMVTIDPRGFVEITDRKKDLIKSRGEWISSVDMENVAGAFEGVLEAAVTGRPDELRDEVPVLWIVPEEGATVEPAAIIAFLAQKFEQWQLPRLEDVRFIDVVPKTTVGKFDKKVLRKQLAEEQA